MYESPYSLYFDDSPLILMSKYNEYGDSYIGLIASDVVGGATDVLTPDEPDFFLNLDGKPYPPNTVISLFLAARYISDDFATIFRNSVEVEILETLPDGSIRIAWVGPVRTRDISTGEEITLPLIYFNNIPGLPIGKDIDGNTVFLKTRPVLMAIVSKTPSKDGNDNVTVISTGDLWNPQELEEKIKNSGYLHDDLKADVDKLGSQQKAQIDSLPAPSVTVNTMFGGIELPYNEVSRYEVEYTQSTPKYDYSRIFEADTEEFVLRYLEKAHEAKFESAKVFTSVNPSSGFIGFEFRIVRVLLRYFAVLKSSGSSIFALKEDYMPNLDAILFEDAFGFYGSELLVRRWYYYNFTTVVFDTDTLKDLILSTGKLRYPSLFDVLATKDGITIRNIYELKNEFYIDENSVRVYHTLLDSSRLRVDIEFSVYVYGDMINYSSPYAIIDIEAMSSELVYDYSGRKAFYYYGDMIQVGDKFVMKSKEVWDGDSLITSTKLGYTYVRPEES
jgi:hypothetical protein